VDESLYADAPDARTVYSWASDHWQYSWKTDSTQGGFLWRVRLDDGTTHYVNIPLP
jgi:hypothetical protein